MLSINTIIGVVLMLIFIGIVLFINGTVQTKRYLKLTGIAIIISFPFVTTNLSYSIYADNIDVINIISTILFLLSWLGFGILQGYTKRTHFTKFILGYWSVNLILLWLGHILDLSYSLFVLFNLIPMYGIYYYVEHLFSGVPYLLMILPLVIGLIGYYMGERFPNIKVSGTFINRR